MNCYGLVIQTTGKNMRETIAIGDIIFQKYCYDSSLVALRLYVIFYYDDIPKKRTFDHFFGIDKCINSPH